MDWRHILVTAAVSALGGWLSHALHLKAKTAQQADQAIGGQQGDAQSILNAAGGAVTNGIEQAAGKALNKGGKP